LAVQTECWWAASSDGPKAVHSAEWTASHSVESSVDSSVGWTTGSKGNWKAALRAVCLVPQKAGRWAANWGARLADWMGVQMDVCWAAHWVLQWADN